MPGRGTTPEELERQGVDERKKENMLREMDRIILTRAMDGIKKLDESEKKAAEDEVKDSEKKKKIILGQVILISSLLFIFGVYNLKHVDFKYLILSVGCFVIGVYSVRTVFDLMSRWSNDNLRDIALTVVFGFCALWSGIVVLNCFPLFWKTFDITTHWIGLLAIIGPPTAAVFRFHDDVKIWWGNFTTFQSHRNN